MPFLPEMQEARQDNADRAMLLNLETTKLHAYSNGFWFTIRPAFQMGFSEPIISRDENDDDNGRV